MPSADDGGPTAQYQPLSVEELEAKSKQFHLFCRGFLKDSQCPESWHCHVSDWALKEILLRVHKREAYYHYFHRSEDGTGVDINQRKLGGLFAYWILKLRPISVDFDDGEESRDYAVPEVEQRKANYLNEYFAAYTLYTYINRWYLLEEDGQPLVIKKPIYSNFHDALIYAFRFRNISIDAMMILVEAIGRDTFDRDKVPTA